MKTHAFRGFLWGYKGVKFWSGGLLGGFAFVVCKGVFAPLWGFLCGGVKGVKKGVNSPNLERGKTDRKRGNFV